MTDLKWDPFHQMSTLQDRINRLFEESFPGAAEKDEEVLCAWRPVVDIYDAGERIVIDAELPGVRREDLAIEMRGNVLTIKGERARVDAVGEESYYRRERCCGTFQRSFAMPQAMDPDRIKAGFKDGILKIEVLKPEKEKPKRVAVE